MKEVNKINIGLDVNNRKLNWAFQHNQIANNHLLMLGSSGQGKTYAIQHLLSQASNMGISSIIFDYSESYSDTKLEKAFEYNLGEKLKQRMVYLEGIPVNPFHVQTVNCNGNSIKEKLSDTADRIADVFSNVFKMGIIQRASLYNACLKGLKGCFVNIGYEQQVGFINEFTDDISIDRDGKIIMDLYALRYLLSFDKTQVSNAVISKISSLVDKNIFKHDDTFDWGSIIYSEGTVTIFQLDNFSDELKKLITEFVLGDLWYYTKKHGDKSKPFIVVLDECQNISHTKSSPASKILTEGRKLGYSGFFITQFLDGSFEKESLIRLEQAALKLYFKPTKEEMKYLAKKLDFDHPQKWQSALNSLCKGECLASCDVENRNGNLQECTIKVRIPKIE